MPAPPTFGNIAKSSSSLLNDDYKYEAKAEIKTNIAGNGVAIKSTFTRSDKGDIGAVLELKKNLFKTDFTAKLDHKGTANITAEHSPAALPGSKVKYEASLDGNTSKITADYKNDMMTATTSIDTIKSVLAVNGTVGFQSIAVGASSSYTYKNKSSWSTPALNASYTGPNYEVGVSVEKLGDKVGVSYHHKMSKELAIALNVEQNTVDKGGNKSTDMNLTLGSNYTIDKDSNVKAKVDANGVLSVLYSQKIRPNATMKLTGQINTAKLSQGNAHKIGIACLMDL